MSAAKPMTCRSWKYFWSIALFRFRVVCQGALGHPGRCCNIMPCGLARRWRRADAE